MVPPCLPRHSALRVLAVLFRCLASLVFLAVGDGRSVVAKFASLGREQQEVAALQALQGTASAPLPLTVAAAPQCSPLLPVTSYPFLMIDRGHLSLHSLASRPSLMNPAEALRLAQGARPRPRAQQREHQACGPPRGAARQQRAVCGAGTHGGVPGELLPEPPGGRGALAGLGSAGRGTSPGTLAAARCGL